MSVVSRESLTQMMDSQRAQFDELRNSGEMSEQSAALFESLFTMVQMLVVLLLERRTKKTSANSSLPSAVLPFDRTAPARAGSRGRGVEHPHAEIANARVAVVEETSEVTDCARCGEDLSEVAAEGHERRIEVDIEFVTTEYRIDAEIKRCPRCGRTSRGRFPQSMPGPLQYGAGVVAFAIDLLISQMVPLRRTQQLLRQLSGRQISETTLLNWVMRVHETLAKWETAAVEQLLALPVMHADETSIRVNRTKHWIHSCSGADVVVKTCHPKRGGEALDAINIIPRYGDRSAGDDDEPGHQPVLVHDRWAAYFKYRRCDHALCGAHLIRNLKHIEEALAHGWAAKMRELLLEACGEVADSDAKKLSHTRFERLSARYDAILTEGTTELPERPVRKGRRGRLPKSEAEKLLDAFVQYKNEILCFAARSEVPFTNNRSERDIRMAKVKQKISGTFRNVNHAHAYCRISSYLQTMSFKGYNSLSAIHVALNGNALDMLGESE